MSVHGTASHDTGFSDPLVAAPGSWRLRRTQLRAVVRVELGRLLRHRGAWGAMFLALLPLMLLSVWAVGGSVVGNPGIPEITVFFASLYRGLFVAMVLFFGCVVIFSTLIRREVRDRTLHHAFLTPIPREVVLVGKYGAGVVAGWLIFGLSTLLSFALAYLPFLGRDPVALRGFLLDGPGLGHLAAYLAATALAVAGYGAVFLAMGLLFKNPVLPALAVYGWELGSFLLPPLLKKISIIYYLLALMPVPVPGGVFEVMLEPPSPGFAVPGLLLVSAALVALSAWRVRRMEILYSED